MKEDVFQKHRYSVYQNWGFQTGTSRDFTGKTDPETAGVVPGS